MSIHARILIVARDDERAGPLAEGLDRLGWRTVTARGPFAAIAALGDLQIEAAIVDLIGAGHEALSFARRLKAACAPRRLPVMAIADPDPQLASHGFDLTLAPPLHPAQAVDAAGEPGADGGGRGGVRAAARDVRRARAAGWSCRRPRAARCGCSASASRRRSSWRSPTRSPATRPRWSAPSPPTRRSTTCTSAPSMRWCCGPARTRKRRCRSSPACGATPGSITSPPCSISAARPTSPRSTPSTKASPTSRRRRCRRTTPPSGCWSWPAPIAARARSAGRWRRPRAPA